MRRERGRGERHRHCCINEEEEREREGGETHRHCAVPGIAILSPAQLLE